MDAIPDFEMAERRWFDALPAPELLTYPWMSPVLEMVVSSLHAGSHFGGERRSR
jgi:hypothetical protein